MQMDFLNSHARAAKILFANDQSVTPIADMTTANLRPKSKKIHLDLKIYIEIRNESISIFRLLTSQKIFSVFKLTKK